MRNKRKPQVVLVLEAKDDYPSGVSLVRRIQSAISVMDAVHGLRCVEVGVVGKNSQTRKDFHALSERSIPIRTRREA